MKYVLSRYALEDKDRRRSTDMPAKPRRRGRKRSLPKPKKRGWRLTGTELVIAAASLGVVMLLAYPSFEGMATNGHLKSAAGDLVADIDLLREKAALESTPVELEFDVGGNTYRSPGLKGGVKSLAKIAPDISLSQAAFGGGNKVIFLSKGTLSQQGNIILTNSRGSTATITCNLTGRTYVKFVMQ